MREEKMSFSSLRLWHELFGGDGVSEELGRRESMACKSSAFGAPVADGELGRWTTQK